MMCEKLHNHAIKFYFTFTYVKPFLQSAQLTIGDKVIEIESVSSNGIVIKYKILYHEIITIIEMIESNIKVIIKEEPSQKTAALLDVSWFEN